jgi:hypothetical protein
VKSSQNDDKQSDVKHGGIDDTLYHYGVLGMHWGHRKGNSSRSSQPGGPPKHKVSEDHIVSRALKAKHVSEMSNADLKAFTTRLQLEKQYKDLTKQEVSGGRKVITEILGNAAKETAKTYVTKYMNKAVEELLKKAAQAKA